MSYMAKVMAMVSSHDLVEELVKANIITDSLGCDIIAKGREIDMSIEVRLDSQELVTEARADTLLEELADRPGFMMPDDVDTDAVAEGIGYVRSGDATLAAAMFKRALGDADLRSIDAALRA